MAPGRERRAELIRTLGAHLLAAGLGDTGLRTLAAAVGTSDRMLLYYFSDKADLLDAVLGRIADDLVALLDGALGAETMPAAALYARLSGLASDPAVAPFMRLWAEIAALGGRGQPPFDRIAASIAAGFGRWVEAHLDVPDPARRRGLAALLLVLVDGAALLDPLDDAAIGDAARAAAAGLLRHAEPR